MSHRDTVYAAPPDQEESERSDEEEPERSGNGPLYGVLFAVALTAGALFLMTRMRDAAALLDCAFTHAPQCRALVDK